MTVADRIKNQREKIGMSQEELAKRMGLKDKSSISKIESSEDKVSLKNIEKIAPILKCSIQYLMGWDEKTEYSPTEEEMIRLFKASTPEIQRAALAVLKAGQQSDG